LTDLATDAPTSPTTPSPTRPTNLKPVIDAIPDECYERPTSRGLFYFARDLVVYALVIWGLVSTNRIYLLIPLWILSGLVVSALFVVGHDAAHQSLFRHRWLNGLVGRVAMLPSFHVFEAWVLGHNRIHHGHTLKRGFDFVWQPLTPEEYSELGPIARLRHRLEWSRFGSGLYYLREVWWNKMIRFTPPRKWARAIRLDSLLVHSVGALAMAGTVLITWAVTGSLMSGLWLWIKVVVVPFLAFTQSIGWVVYVHHIAPDIHWWERREWNKFKGQVEGTTILHAPRGMDFFFHWIFEHAPHHVDMRIPMYHLKKAGQAMKMAFPDSVIEKKLRVRDYLRSVRSCKLYDYGSGRWLTYGDAAGSLRSEAAVPAT